MQMRYLTNANTISDKCKWDIWQMQMRYLANASKISDKPNNILSDKGKFLTNKNDQAGQIYLTNANCRPL